MSSIHFPVLRVLKPGGRFIFNVWDRIEENEFALAVTDALKIVFPESPPSFLARTPHGHHDIDTSLSDLRSAGFAQIDAVTLACRSLAHSHREPAIGYCQGTPLRNEIEARDASRLQEATDAAAAEVARRFSLGPVDGKMQALIFSASRSA